MLMIPAIDMAQTGANIVALRKVDNLVVLAALLGVRIDDIIAIGK